MVDGFDIRCSLQHDVGTDTYGKWGVFMNGKISGKTGNLDLHRSVAAGRPASQPASLPACLEAQAITQAGGLAGIQAGSVCSLLCCKQPWWLMLCHKVSEPIALAC
jgi:hypothetical protein